jgi:fatty acid desaturase
MNLSPDEQIYKIAKSSLRSVGGMGYAEFKRSLRPRYFIVWRDIFLGYVALAVPSLLLIQVQRLAGTWIVALAIPVAAVLYGFIFAYLNLFMHEAAHWNLAANETLNDRLANGLIGVFFGQSVQAYRLVHFRHHQHHGTPLDAEHSYFDPLNARFFAGALLGIRAFQVARKRDACVSSEERLLRRGSRHNLLQGMLLNGIIVVGAFLAGHWAISVAWAAGMLGLFPFFNALRQLLEHRDEQASDETDYSKVAHGRINRLFGDSLLAQTLGGAGFNRHLLHHWEPQISYTRLQELEAFVLDCECAPLFHQRQTTYTRVFLRLLRWRRP